MQDRLYAEFWRSVSPAESNKHKTADLPEDRVLPSKPAFTYTGVDCFGPFKVRRGRSKVKRYCVYSPVWLSVQYTLK